ncbi:MAG: DUF4358 domain-containing protein [Bacillota bacterium]|nr:DUF4358 domain-containing protein [Bacillota bacterium]
MKKYIALILSLLTVLCLCAACGHSGTAVVSNDPGMDVISAAANGAVGNEDMQDIPDSYIQNTMKISADSYSECVAKISKVGTNIDEYGIFKTDDVEAMKAALEDYLEYREMIWMDEYLPTEHPKLQNAQVWVLGDYVMYAILDSDTISAAKTAFEGCFEI